MKKFMSLVRLLFVQQYRTKPTEGKKKKGGTIAVFIILGICFIPILFGIAVVTYELGKLAGCDAGILSVLIFASQTLVFVFGLSSLMVTVFTSKDADKLLFLPMRSSTIFAAKLTVAYINEVITTAVTILFLFLPYGIGASAPFGFYPMLLIALVLIPLFPLLLGCIVAIPLSALIAKVGKNGVLKVILQAVLFVLIMALYIFISFELGFISGDTEPSADAAQMILQKIQGIAANMKYVHSDFALAGAMTAATFGAFALNLLIALGENILLLGLVLLMSVPFYRWILTSSLESVGGTSRKKANKGDLQVKNKGAIKELIVTDIKRVSRDGQMGFQALMNIVVLPLMIGLFYVIFTIGGASEGEENIVGTLRSMPLYQIIAPIVIMAYMSMLGITSNVLGNYPISRENKSFYLVKSLPISFNKYLLAKVILATSATLISDFLTCLLVVILFGVEWYYGIAMLLTMAFLGFGGLCIMTLIDLKNPKLGWANFNQSLKNAKNSWLAMLVGLLTSLAVGLLSAGFMVWYAANASWYVSLLMWIVLIAFAVGFAAVSYKAMTANAEKNFNSIEP